MLRWLPFVALAACYLPQNDGGALDADAPADEASPDDAATGSTGVTGPTAPTYVPPTVLVYPPLDIVPVYPNGCGDACPYTPVSMADPIIPRAKTLPPLATCSGMDGARVLVDETFATVPAAAEPVNALGWESDGQTIRPVAPNVYPNHAVGIVFWIDVCPTSTAVVTAASRVIASDLRDPTSKVELFVYSFDHALNPVSLWYTHPLRAGNRRPLEVFESPIPPTTRRIAIAVVATFGPQESGSVILDDLRASMEPQKPATTPVYSESFAAQSLAGWTQLAGTWIVPSEQYAVLYNDPAARPIESMLSRAIPLPAWSPGDELRASLLAATTFTDNASLFFYRLRFDTGEIVQGPKLDRGYDTLRIAPFRIPAGASSLSLELVGYLGVNETTSFSVDDIVIEKLP